MSEAEIRALLIDCLVVWGVPARVTVAGGKILISAAPGIFEVRRAPAELRPVRWFLETPERRAAHRPPRPTPSIVALLSALRNGLGAEGGAALRVGAD